MRTYYINLDRDVDRRRHMEQLSEKLSWPMTRIPAKTPSDITPDVDRKYFVNDIWKNLKRLKSFDDREKACALSHITALRKFIDDSDSTTDIGVVLEDDVDTDTKDMKEIKDMVDAAFIARPDLDFLFLGKTGEDCDGYPMHIAGPQLVKPRCCAGMFAYAITKRGAKKLLNNLSLAERLDLYLGDLYRRDALKALSVHPNLVYEKEGFQSTIRDAANSNPRSGCVRTEGFMRLVKTGRCDMVTVFMIIIIIAIVVLSVWRRLR